jgi:hypothetical protein
MIIKDTYIHLDSSGEGISLLVKGKKEDLSFIIYKAMEKNHTFHHIVLAAVEVLELEKPCESEENHTQKN